jgi:glucans biosynthesis protein C
VAVTTASGAGGPRLSTAPERGERYRYLDNLKVGVIAAVIAAHGVIGYVDIPDLWPYVGVQETTLSPVSVTVLFAVAGPFGFFVMALLFLVAGLLTPASLARKGPGRFARDRLLRLGLPFVVFFLLLWPALLYAVYRPFGHFSGSYWAFFRDNYPDSGPLWFVGVLLLLSLIYAGWRGIHPTARARARPLTVRLLMVLALAVAGASFLIRLVYPYGGQGPLDLNQFQWPECAALFALGIAVSGEGWLSTVPDRIHRAARTVTAWVAGATAAVLAVTIPLGVPPEDFAGGRHWAALLFALLGGPLTVFGSVWFLAVAQRHLDRPWPHGPALARSAYGAFILQGVFLLGLAVALRAGPVPAELKAVVVAVGAVIGSFTLSWLLVDRVPPLRRIL